MASVGELGATRGVDYGNTVFTDKQSTGVTADDFLKLMVAQFQNQDFMNPVDDTQYVAQLAQFATMQQMQELASYSKQNYVLSLIGQTVTAAKFKVNGEIDSVTGPIDRISLVDNEYLVYIGDKSFSLEQIMEIGAADASGPADQEQADYTQAGFLLSLVGKSVTVTNSDDDEITGVVEKVVLNDGMKLLVDGKWYTLGDLVSAENATSDSEPTAPGVPETPETEGGAQA